MLGRATAALAVFAGLALAGNMDRPTQAQTTAAGPVLSPELRRFAEDCELLGHGTVIKLEESLRGLRSGQLRTKNNAATIRQAEADIAAIKSRQRVIVPSLHFPVSAGEIGRLPGTGGHIEQILGPDEMLLKCLFRVQVVVTRHYNRVSETVTRPVLFKVRGVSTKDYSEGSDAEMLQTFRITTAETYRTVDGKSAAALIAEPVDMQPIENYLRSKPAF